jgi:hypothetical protein
MILHPYNIKYLDIVHHGAIFVERLPKERWKCISVVKGIAELLFS